MTTQFRRERHSVTDLKIHLVCVTKYRRSVFTAESLDLIKKSFCEVAEKMDFQVLEFNGEDNHVHTLIEYPPKLSVSQIVNVLKGVSSRRYGQAGYQKPHKKALWSPSYFAVSVGGAPLEVLKQYIKNQEKRDNAVLGVSPMSDCRQKPS
ncbi:MAG: IS200/IS605 family transposase [Calothrix sp. MO_167.B12]|nr:IS200/IS605 family transposase [Calothrix sp. MO_167.B12]